ncbi:hypothetical protein GCM10009530_59710 [Microbispora corallina]|uniref:Major facilitator superfamily (MFS) profile domain-containing protein n=2 Tax=Microbispora corallina TaxID=83302 RepID=A0ABQ4GA44_9ACTN|nr:hypothetical protein Mco01_69540 [Microbispora corallina]
MRVSPQPYDQFMRAAYNEALVMLGYVLGMIITPVVGGWASEWVGGKLLNETMFMCALLFQVAFLFGLARLLFRGARWLVRTSARRWQMPKAQEPS